MDIINAANRQQKRPQTTLVYFATVNDFLAATEMTEEEKNQRAEWEWEISTDTRTNKDLWITKKIENLQNHRKLEDLFMTTRFRRYTKNLMVIKSFICLCSNQLSYCSIQFEPAQFLLEPAQ